MRQLVTSRLVVFAAVLSLAVWGCGVKDAKKRRPSPTLGQVQAPSVVSPTPVAPGLPVAPGQPGTPTLPGQPGQPSIPGVAPTSGGVALTGQLQLARSTHTATKLQTGEVLVAGGLAAGSQPTDTVEVYTTQGTWQTLSSKLTHARAGHSALLLPDGRVWLAGGEDAQGTLSSTEFYDPNTGAFSAGPTLTEARSGHAAVLYQSNNQLMVMLVGGAQRVLAGVSSLDSTEVLDLTTGTVSAGPVLGTARVGAQAHLVGGQMILVVGGLNVQGQNVAAATPAQNEVFDIPTGQFAAAPGMSIARAAAASVLLPTDEVVTTGGRSSAGYENSTEVFSLSQGGSAPGALLSQARAGHTANLLLDGRVLLLGGTDGTAALAGTEVFDGQVFTSLPASLVVARSGHTATLLDNGNVLVVGGVDFGGTPVSAVEEFDPVGVAAPSMQAPSIVSVNPASGAAGDVLTIDGSGFAAVAADNTVTIGGVVAQVTAATPSQLMVEIPAGAPAGSADLKVTVAGLTSAPVQFTVNPSTTGPVIASISPQLGREGQAVAIAGDGFSLTATTVKFGTIQAPAQVLTTRLIAVNVPQGATTGPVTVEVAGQVSNPVTFTVVPATTPTPGQITVDFTRFPTSVETGKRYTVTWDVKGAQVVTRTHVQWGLISGVYTNQSPVKSGTSGSYTNQPTAPANPMDIYVIVETEADGQLLRTPERVIQIVVPGQQPGTPATPGTPGSGSPTGPTIDFVQSSLPGQVAPGDTVQLQWEISNVQTVDLTNVAWGEQTGNLPNLTMAQQGLPGVFADMVVVPATATGFVVKGRAVVDGGTLIETTEYVLSVAVPGQPTTPPVTTPPVTPPVTTPPVTTQPVTPTPTMPAWPATIDITSLPGGGVAPGDIFTVEWEVQNAQVVTDSLVRWGDQPGQYTGVGAPQAGSAGFFSQVVTAPATAGDIYMMAECVADGNLIRSNEQVLPVIATGNPPIATPGTPTTGTPTAGTPTTGTPGTGTVATTPMPPANTSKIVLKSLDYPHDGFEGDKLKIKWSFTGAKSLQTNVVEWGTTSGQYTQNTGNAGKQYWLFGDYQEEITLPSQPGAVYFRLRAVDANGSYTSSEFTIRVKDAPEIRITSVPSKVKPGSSAKVAWEVVGGTKVTDTYVRWGTSSKAYYSRSRSFSGAAGAFTGDVTTGILQSGKVYLAVEAVVDGKKVVSAEREFGVRHDLEIKNISFPAKVKGRDKFDIKWGLDHVSTLEHVNVHWGTETGKYPYFTTVIDKKSFWGTYSGDVTAPINGKIYFVVHAKGDGQEIYSKEYVIDVQGLPQVTVAAPTQVDGNSTVTISWTASNVARVTNTRVRWHTGGLLTSLFAHSTPLQNGPAGTFKASFQAPKDGKIEFWVEGYGDGEKFKSKDGSISVRDAFSLKVSYPQTVNGGDTFNVSWTISGAAKVTDSDLHYTTVSWFWNPFDNTTNQSGGSGTYKAQLKAPDKGELYFYVEGKRDGVSFKSATYTIKIQTRIVIDVYSYPTTVKPGKGLTIRWKIGNLGKLEHGNVHWGPSSGSLYNYGKVYTSKSFWGTYSNDITAPTSGNIFFTVHVKGDGQDVYSPEKVVNIR